MTMLMAFEERGSGPPVILLHGYPLSRAMWAPQRLELARRYRVITPDMRGMGETPPSDVEFSMDMLADDVIALLEHLSINGPIVLGGLSMGGYVAQAFAAQHPERLRGLILMDTKAVADTPEMAQKREETAAEVLETGDVKKVVDAMIPRLFASDTLNEPERIAELTSVMEATTPKGIAGALRCMAGRPDRRNDLGKIRVPTLVLVGAEDAISPPTEAQSIADAISDSRFAVIPQAGHMAPWENPEGVNAALLDFLDRLA
jgi:pimeloyl-ACP methyl ester carboxylesterase